MLYGPPKPLPSSPLTAGHRWYLQPPRYLPHRRHNPQPPRRLAALKRGQANRWLWLAGGTACGLAFRCGVLQGLCWPRHDADSQKLNRRVINQVVESRKGGWEPVVDAKREEWQHGAGLGH